MKRVKLWNKYGQGKFALVDDEDYEEINKVHWNLSKIGYVFRNAHITKKRYKWLSMHRFLLKAKKGQEIDHINTDKLDNRKANLRFITHKQNCQNLKLRINNSDTFGVTFRKRDNKWQAQTGKKYIGIYKTREDARKAYLKYISL